MTLLPLVLLGGCSLAAGDNQARHADEGPLVIELFTSQGCSSCPSAERFLDKLAHQGQLDGRALAPLAFHVDYWDDLGWADPFAKPEWTQRQRGYAAALGDTSVYTPELVVAGGAGVVGSHVMDAQHAIASAPRQAKLAATAQWKDRAVTIDATAPANADVFVALYQDGTSTKVKRGENAGETLASDRVVRALARVAPAGKHATLTVALDPTWRVAGAVAFAQKTNHQIIGAALLPHN